MTAPKRHIVILGGQAYQDKDPLPEKEPGMEFWAQNALEQWIKPAVSFDTDSIDMLGISRSERLKLLDNAKPIDNVAMLAEVVDRWYEIHEPELTAELHPDHLAWLSKNHMTVYAQDDYHIDWDAHPEFMNLRQYPIDEVQALTPHGNYLAGTFSYMIAHAILEGVDKISFHWMAKHVVRSPNEPRSAQSNLEYWLGVAEGRGIEIDPGDLWLLRTWWGGRYGYDGMPPEWHAGKAERDYHAYLTEGYGHIYDPDDIG